MTYVEIKTFHSTMFSRRIFNFTLIKRFSSNSTPKSIDWKTLKFKTKVPESSVPSAFSEKTERIKITEEEIILLEKLSLVDLERK